MLYGNGNQHHRSDGKYAVGILVMVLVVIVAVFCITGFKGKPKEVYLEDMQGETLPDGSTRYDLGDGDFVIEPGN